MRSLFYLFIAIWSLVFISYNVQATEVYQLPEGYYFNSGEFTTATGKTVKAISFFIPGDYENCEKHMKAYSDVTNCGSCSLYPIPNSYVINNWVTK